VASLGAPVHLLYDNCILHSRSTTNNRPITMGTVVVARREATPQRCSTADANGRPKLADERHSSAASGKPRQGSFVHAHSLPPPHHQQSATAPTPRLTLLLASYDSTPDLRAVAFDHRTTPQGSQVQVVRRLAPSGRGCDGCAPLRPLGARGVHGAPLVPGWPPCALGYYRKTRGRYAACWSIFGVFSLSPRLLQNVLVTGSKAWES
jgi:hypothetical protein